VLVRAVEEPVELGEPRTVPVGKRFSTSASMSTSECASSSRAGERVSSYDSYAGLEWGDETLTTCGV
jgi:hypothetical protein